MSNLAIVQTTTPAPLDEAERQVWRLVRDSFLESKHNLSGSVETLKRYTSTLRMFFGDFPKSPADYTAQEVLAFADMPALTGPRKGLPALTGTRNGRIACLSSFYQFAQHWTLPGPDGRPRRLLPLDYVAPTLNVSYSRPARAKHRAIAEDDLSKIFASIDHDAIQGKRDFSFLIFLLLTGRRRNEVARLTWGDLAQTTFTDEKTGQVRSGWTYQYTRKGASNQWRVRECPAVCVEALMDYLTASGRMERMTPSSALWLCLAPPQGGGYAAGKELQLSGHGMLRILKQYCVKAGIPPERVCIHSLRHNAAISKYAVTDKDIFAVSKWLDHSSVAVTTAYMGDMVAVADKEQDAMAARYPFLR
jgi:integrase